MCYVNILLPIIILVLEICFGHRYFVLSAQIIIAHQPWRYRIISHTQNDTQFMLAADIYSKALIFMDTHSLTLADCLPPFI
jgi:hypothetical protein